MNARVTLARYGRWALIGAVLVVSVDRPVFAQSLGAVAKEAEAQRKTTKSSGKVYTNDNLRGAPAPTPAAPAAAPTTPATDTSAGADGKAKPDLAKDEAAWRDRIKAERDALARSEAFSAALQSQINGLYGEFTACQAPPQCNEISAKRQKAMGELDRVKKETETHTKAIADIQEEARKAGVPAGWVR